MATLDPTTQSNYTQVISKHIHLDWKVDYDALIISGTAVHDLEAVANDVNLVVFDISLLNIKRAVIDGKETKFDIGAVHPVMGAPLSITLPNPLQKGDKLKLSIEYSTISPDSVSGDGPASALQWLDKEQTQGKTQPFLFSQCQPIYARTLLPVMDSPSVKITYSADVLSKLPVLLSANLVGKDEVVYKYKSPVPIPSYLIAIAAGDLVYKAFDKLPGKDWTTGVWAEPSLIDAAHWEFSADTARFLAAEEEAIKSSYRFGVYDILIPPPSFPYGGMENPCISFLTPSLLTGDRSLVDVVVHELTHSWFGNGVTHAHASHFWLNEGWTTYIERLLQQKLHGPAHRGFSFLIGKKSLDEALKEYTNKPKYQQLVIEFSKGEDPDDAYSVIPYEKGANFLYYLENLLGGLDVFLPYVSSYVNAYIGASITTEIWKDHLYTYWRKYDSEHGTEKIKALDSINWKEWFSGQALLFPWRTNMTPLLLNHHGPSQKSGTRVGTCLLMVLAFDEEKDLGQWTNGNQIGTSSGSRFVLLDPSFPVVFLERLHQFDPLPSSHLLHLSKATQRFRLRFYHIVLAGGKDSEVAIQFKEKAVNWIIGNEDAGAKVIKGRMKFCRPVFRLVGRVDSDLAQTVFKANQTLFHPIARRLISKDLGLT
ncbi:peptidase family M1-domain-containing protein [Flagelloscypha sp. PMI_526]|nr:peptidase family M1-domain-containing protein [Flagelloscypha sp. PMI_526]